MFYSCYAPVDYGCETCHEREYAEGSDINIEAGLSALTPYFVHIVDKFYNHYVQRVVTNSSGALTITSYGLPNNFFNRYAGEIEVKISAISAGPFINFQLDGVLKNCLVITITKGVEYCYSSPSFSSGGTMSPVTVRNTDSSFSQQVDCGGTLILEDITYMIYVEGVFSGSATLPAGVDNIINII